MTAFEPSPDDDRLAFQAANRLWIETSNELIKLRISVARLAQAMSLGHLIPKPKSEASGDEFVIDMQEAPYEVLHMAAITDRGWNALVGEMIERYIQNLHASDTSLLD